MFSAAFGCGGAALSEVWRKDHLGLRLAFVLVAFRGRPHRHFGQATRSRRYPRSPIAAQAPAAQKGTRTQQRPSWVGFERGANGRDAQSAWLHVIHPARRIAMLDRTIGGIVMIWGGLVRANREGHPAR
jgi:hypothetical protein